MGIINLDVNMLWYDDDKKRTLEEKVVRAAEYYQAKYGGAPTVCYVNPESLEGQQARVGLIVLKANRTIIKNHFWLGIEDAKTNRPAG